MWHVCAAYATRKAEQLRIGAIVRLLCRVPPCALLLRENHVARTDTALVRYSAFAQDRALKVRVQGQPVPAVQKEESNQVIAQRAQRKGGGGREGGREEVK